MHSSFDDANVKSLVPFCDKALELCPLEHSQNHIMLKMAM